MLSVLIDILTTVDLLDLPSCVSLVFSPIISIGQNMSWGHVTEDIILAVNDVFYLSVAETWSLIFLNPR